MFDLLKKYRTPLLAGILVLAALLVYSANLRHREATSPFENLVFQITAPLQMGIDWVVEGISEPVRQYVWLVDTKRQNELLKRENARLRSELEGLHEVDLENERLRRLLAFRETARLSALPARVIAEDASSWFRTVVIDKGEKDGVRQGLPVVVAEGVVGRIIACGSNQSRVLLITDASSAIAALVQRSRARGIARGQGNVLTLEYAASQEEIEVGDQVITSGTGGLFPKGLPIGEVVRVSRQAFGLFQGVEIAPVVDFSRLEEVLVLLVEGK